MNTKIRVLQGSNQIGGNIIEIEGENSRLILDYGIPLTETDGNPADCDLTDERNSRFLPQIPDLFSEKPQKETLVLLSHAHPDHFGLLRYISLSVPIYTTEITKKLLNKTSQMLYDNVFDNLNTKVIKDKTETKDFIIETILVNHSVAGACAFLITDKKTSKNIFYSGDLRLHGRDNTDLINFIQSRNKVDYLITEGTNFDREENCTKTEFDVENEMTELFRENKMSIVCFSPINTDRFISTYNACKKAGKILVIDPYTVYMTEIFKNVDIPKFESENIKIYCVPNSQSKKIFEDENNKKMGENKILFKEIMKNPEKYVVKDNNRVTKSIMKRKNIKNINVVYSYWQGYLEKENYRWNKFKNEIKHIHTSGHIFKNDLIKFTETINPKFIIPVHTLAESGFKETFGQKVLTLNKNNYAEIIFS